MSVVLQFAIKLMVRLILWAVAAVIGWKLGGFVGRKVAERRFNNNK